MVSFCNTRMDYIATSVFFLLLFSLHISFSHISHSTLIYLLQLTFGLFGSGGALPIVSAGGLGGSGFARVDPADGAGGTCALHCCEACVALFTLFVVHRNIISTLKMKHYYTFITHLIILMSVRLERIYQCLLTYYIYAQ